MIVRIVGIDDYYSVFPTARTPFGSEAFVRLNADKADAVRCFVGYDEKEAPRLGIVLGWDGSERTWRCPFSASFGEISCNEPQSLERIYDFVAELAETLSPNALSITLPPEYYDPVTLPKLCGILHGAASRTVLDYDYYYPLSQADDFVAHLSRAARKNFNRGMSAGFAFEPCALARAYAVIAANRSAHGYPLRMTLDQVEQTAHKAVHVDAYVLTLKGADVAAAIVYRLTSDIALVVYWGDAPGYGEHRPMNVLPYHLFRHYAALGCRIMDIGVSSTHGIPSTGLVNFKESLGCLTALKPTFLLSRAHD